MKRYVDKGKGFFVSRHIVVCPKHKDITYPVLTCDQNNTEEKSLTMKLMLLQTYNESSKLISNDTDKETESETFSQYDDDRNSVISENSKKRRVDYYENPNECSNCSYYLNELEHKQEINQELREQNKELREHNSFLRTVASSNALNKKQNERSYANVLTNCPPKPSFVQLIVKPNTNFKGDTLQLIQKQVSVKTKAKVLNMKKTDNGNIFLKCSSEEDSQAILRVLNNENSADITAKICEKNNPMIKITNIVSIEDTTQMTKDIIERNQLTPGSLNIVHTFKQRNNKIAALAQVTGESYTKIMNSGYIFVGYQNCKVYDYFNLSTCKNCCGYNHSDRICREVFKRPIACYKCAGNHEAKDCQSSTKACINCRSANKYLTKKRSEDHEATDYGKCETYKAKWNQYVNNTNYPWTPQPITFQSSNTLVQ
uniref:Pre-C2HC domain-containing protein n=1 Tax=Trichogramma kaykai TaxID=54128 RepID=A0ABD2VUW3_9HYME